MPAEDLVCVYLGGPIFLFVDDDFGIWDDWRDRWIAAAEQSLLLSCRRWKTGTLLVPDSLIKEDNFYKKISKGIKHFEPNLAGLYPYILICSVDVTRGCCLWICQIEVTKSENCT